MGGRGTTEFEITEVQAFDLLQKLGWFKYTRIGDKNVQFPPLRNSLFD